jgi:hypothetical protein
MPTSADANALRLADAIREVTDSMCRADEIGDGARAAEAAKALPPLYGHLAAIKATTPKALWAKATVIASDLPPEWPDDYTGQLLRSLLVDLGAMPDAV